MYIWYSHLLKKEGGTNLICIKKCSSVVRINKSDFNNYLLTVTDKANVYTISHRGPGIGHNSARNCIPKAISANKQTNSLLR